MARLLDERAKDGFAAAVIRLAGGLVVVLVAAIFIGIAAAALPLLAGARVEARVETPVASPVAALVWWSDGHEWLWLDTAGALRRSDGGRVSLNAPWVGPLSAWYQASNGLTAVLDGTGTAHVGTVSVRTSTGREGPGVGGRWRAWAEPLTLPAGSRWKRTAVASDADGGVLLMAWNNDAALLFRWHDRRRQWQEETGPWTGTVTAAAVGDGLRFAAAVDGRGRLQVASLPDGRLETVSGLDAPVALPLFLVGGESLVAVAPDGRVSVLLRIPQVLVHNRSERHLAVGSRRLEPGQRAVVPDDRSAARLAESNGIEIHPVPPQWQVVRHLPRFRDRPTAVAASPFDRTFAVVGEGGALALYHSTSGRRLLRARTVPGAPTVVAFSDRGRQIAAAGPAQIITADLHNPHPEVGLRSLFLPVWYEGYAEPRLIWQSTGGSDNFEPKLSLWPLIVGTLKATVYAMLISVPLALLAAIYVSLLAPRWLQAVVKPTVELMAAVPTVVVGFLAALWLAPRLEAYFFQGVFAVALLPVVVITAIAVWRLLPLAFRNRAPDGTELLLLAAVAAVVLAVGWRAATLLEAAFFAGDLPRWLFTELDHRYDQRNAIVVGIALGFAVIPVIFTIAEDACSSVPKSLTRAARALGATRWQAAMRMVVPAASPGLFAAVMLGLGRAIGETMIVLMASGNTPILGFGPLDGMRTMAAAIAFEIPEAAVGSTLYRVLFLAGLLLFVVTFVISTLADLVGRALRRRYAAF